MIREWTTGQWALRVTAALGPVVAMLATGPAGHPPRVSLVVLVAGLSIAHGRLPESPIGIVAMGLVVVWWGLASGDAVSAWALLAAAALLVSHLAALVAAYGPDGLGVDRGTVRLWAVRAAVVFLIAPAAWALTLLVRGRPELPWLWVAGLAVALAVTVVATLAVPGEDGA
jgi:hypothetical protein